MKTPNLCSHGISAPALGFALISLFATASVVALKADDTNAPVASTKSSKFSSDATATNVPQIRLKPGTGMQDPDWLARHQKLIESAKAHADAKVVFLGDSITDWWDHGSFNHYYQDLNALNLGYWADSTEHLLWRISNGEIDGLHPRAVVILIGINNFLHYDKTTPQEVADGVKAIIGVVHDKMPNAQILLIGLLPKGEANDPIRGKVAATNQILATLADGTSVKFLDVGSHFLSPDGSLIPGITKDKLHPSAAGYEVYAQAINPTLFAMLNLPAPPPMPPAPAPEEKKP